MKTAHTPSAPARRAISPQAGGWRRAFRGGAAAATALLVLAGTGAGVRAETPLPPGVPGASTSLWSLKGDANTVYLLGTVHLLRPADYPLPKIMDAAFADSKVLVMEALSSDMESPATQALILQLGMYQDGRTLKDELKPETYALFEKRAGAAGVPAAMLNSFKPWMAALTVVMQEIISSGFDPKMGVDKHFEKRAQDAGMTVEAFETAEFQLKMFDTLSADLGNDFMVQMLDESEHMRKQLDAMVAAWKSGNGTELEKLMLESFDGYPQVKKALLTDRNTNWVAKLEGDYLKRPENVLVVVGAGHLVGADSVVEQLTKKGHKLTQH